MKLNEYTQKISVRHIEAHLVFFLGIFYSVTLYAR
jgi:hypothetical protein